MLGIGACISGLIPRHCLLLRGDNYPAPWLHLLITFFFYEPQTHCRIRLYRNSYWYFYSGVLLQRYWSTGRSSVHVVWWASYPYLWYLAVCTSFEKGLMTELQKAIKAYRQTYRQGKPGGTIKALALLCKVSPRTIVYWENGKKCWAEHAKKTKRSFPDYLSLIQKATQERTSLTD